MSALEYAEIMMATDLSTERLQAVITYLRAVEESAGNGSIQNFGEAIAASAQRLTEMMAEKIVESSFNKTAREQLLFDLDFAQRSQLSDWLLEEASARATENTSAKDVLTQLANSLSSVQWHYSVCVGVEERTLDKPEDWSVTDITSTLSMIALAVHRRAQVTEDAQTSALFRDEAKCLRETVDRLSPMIEPPDYPEEYSPEGYSLPD